MLLLGTSLGLAVFFGGAFVWSWRSRGKLAEQLSAAEEQLAETRREIAASKQSFEQLKSKYAHDLRSPLQAAMGYADLLMAESTGNLNPKQKRFLENLALATRKIVDIIEQD
jgi:signal transduction histidine kinase